MIPTFSARRSAEELAAAIDAGRAPRDADTASLVGLVDALRDVEPVTPRSDFSADLRARLMTEAETALRPEAAQLLLPARQRGKRERRLVALASAFVVVGGTTTVAAAAQDALPGETLYPIKRGIEEAEAGLSRGPAGKGRDLLQQATRRLDEAGALASSDTATAQERVPAAVEDFSATADEGARLLFESFREDADPGSVTSVRAFAAESIATLETLAASAPVDATDELATAAVLVQDLDQQASALCGSCGPDLPVVEVPGILLAQAEAERALAQTAGRRLSNSHPVVVPLAPEKDRERAGDETDGGPRSDGGAQGPDRDGGTAQQPAPSLPSPTDEPGLPSLIPDLDPLLPQDQKQPGEKESTKPLRDLTDDLTDGLGGAVETLLPEPDSVLDSDGGLLD